MAVTEVGATPRSPDHLRESVRTRDDEIVLSGFDCAKGEAFEWKEPPMVFTGLRNESQPRLPSTPYYVVLSAHAVADEPNTQIGAWKDLKHLGHATLCPGPSDDPIVGNQHFQSLKTGGALEWSATMKVSWRGSHDRRHQ
jgi:hypothetical protein